MIRDYLEAIGGFALCFAFLLFLIAAAFLGARLIGVEATWTWWEAIVVTLLVFAIFVMAKDDDVQLHVLHRANGHLAEVEKRLAAIEARLEGLDQKAAKSTDKVASIDKRLEARGW